MKKRSEKKIRKTLGVVLFIVAIVVMLVNIFIEISLKKFGIEKITDYLYSINAAEYDYDFANKLIESGFLTSSAGCSTVRSGNLMGRNFDWTYDDEVEYIVKTQNDGEKFATIGVASLTGIPNKKAEKAGYSIRYYFLPFLTVDGINENGVCVSMNEVPGVDIKPTTGTNPGGERLCFAIAPRYILDYATSVEDAVRILKEKDLYGYNMGDEPYEVHLMISDPQSTVIAEIIDNELVILDGSVMTNYYLGIDHYTDHAEGVERYNILKEKYDSVTDKETMFKLLDEVKYSNLYNEEMDPPWYSEVYGEYFSENGEEFTIRSNPDDFIEILREEKEGYSEKKRDGYFWQTCHASVYDMEELTLDIKVQEGKKIYSVVLEPLTELEQTRANNFRTATTMIPLETVCLFILLVIVYGLIFENGLSDKKSKWFLVMSALTAFAVLADLISWIYEGRAAHSGMLYVSCYFSMIMGGILAVPFMYYEYEYLSERKKVTPWAARIFAFVNLLMLILITVLTFMGKVFRIVDGVFYPGDMYFLIVVIPIFNLVNIIASIIWARNILGTHDVIAFSVYGVIPLVFAAYEFVDSSLELAYVATTFSVFFVYVMLQAGKTNELKMRQQLLEELCLIDQLTNLNNRRAYDDMIDVLPDKVDAGALFCDANRLKYTNDKFGHKAGDALLINFAGILTDYFDRDTVFRISGDEFVVLLRNISEKDFEKKYAEFVEICNKNDEVASVGGVYGYGENVTSIIGRAEKLMYEVKDEFHRTHPEYNR